MKKRKKLKVKNLILLILFAAAFVLLIVFGYKFLYKTFFAEKETSDTVHIVDDIDDLESETEEKIVILDDEETTETTEETIEVDPALFTDTDSVLIVANKKHKLPDGYVPDDLVTTVLGCEMKQEAADALAEMVSAASEDGVTLKISSAYRSEAYQKQLYDGYVEKYGVETADTISSRPGYSDHQTGLAADFVEGDGSMNGINFNQSFEDTDSGTWLREHAHEYGFIMRYPKGKQDITGYAYEPWHYRYVGVYTATEIWNVDPFESFEEYFNVEGGDYE